MAAGDMIGDVLPWEETQEQIEQVWARRAAELARVPPEGQVGEQLTLLIFRLGQDLFGFEACHAFGIRLAGHITRVPRVPAWVAGIWNHRGRILSVVDLAAFFDLPRPGPATTPWLVVTATPAMEVALLVDEVLSVQDVGLDLLQEPAAVVHGLPSEQVRGVALHTGPNGQQGLLTVLDLPALMADARLVINQQPGP